MGRRRSPLRRRGRGRGAMAGQEGWGSVAEADQGPCIRITGLRAMGCHGVRQEEGVQPQPFVVDLELRLDLGRAGRSDALEDTVDYAAAARVAYAVLAGPRRLLLERLAAEIAERLLAAFPALAGGVVEVHKPLAPLGLPVADVSVRWPFVRPLRPEG